MIDAATRDGGGWRELEARLRPFVARRVAAAADVDDVVQDVFLRLQRGLPQLRDEDRFGPWVYRVARSAIGDHRRRAGRSREVDDDDALEAAADSEPEEATAATDLALYVAPFVAMLPSPYREALTLTELEGLTQREAAEMSGVSLSGMKSRVQRGRELLRDALLECCHIALDARGGVMSCEPRADGKLPDSCCRPPRDG